MTKIFYHDQMPDGSPVKVLVDPQNVLLPKSKSTRGGHHRRMTPPQRAAAVASVRSILDALGSGDHKDSETEIRKLTALAL